MPTVRNRAMPSPGWSDAVNQASKMPAHRQPSELAITVPVSTFDLPAMRMVSRLVRYRSMAPIAPPRATRKTWVMMLYRLVLFCLNYKIRGRIAGGMIEDCLIADRRLKIAVILRWSLGV